MERDGNVPFLDVYIYRRPDSLGHKVYLNHPSNLQALLSILVHRARAPCDKESLHDELEFPKTMFKENGYNI